MFSFVFLFFFSSRRRHTRLVSDWNSDVCSSDLALAAGVVSGPLSEGALVLSLARKHLSLIRDLGSGGDRKTRVAPLGDLDRRSLEPSRVVQLRETVGHLVAGRQEKRRVLAHPDHDRTRLAALEILLSMDPPVLAGRDVEPHGRLVVNHSPVRPEVDPTLVWIARHDQAAGADVPPSDLLLVQGPGDLEQVDPA